MKTKEKEAVSVAPTATFIRLANINVPDMLILLAVAWMARLAFMALFWQSGNSPLYYAGFACHSSPGARFWQPVLLLVYAVLIIAYACYSGLETWMDSPSHQTIERIPLFIGFLTVLAFGTRMLLFSLNAPHKWVRTAVGCYVLGIVLIFGRGLAEKCLGHESVAPANSSPGKKSGSLTHVLKLPSFSTSS